MSEQARILVIDDEPDFRSMLAGELTAEGHGVLTASDGAAAISTLKTDEFDVVVTDLRMPGASGIDVLRTAREYAPETEVVLTTAYGSLDVAIECLRGGAFDFVQKPFNVVDLVSTVARAIAHRRARSATELHQASQAILAARDLDRLPEVIVEVTRKVMVADDASLMLPDAQGRLYVAHSSSLSPEIRVSMHASTQERVADRIARTKEPAIISEGLANDPRFNNIVDFQRVNSSIVFPLYTGNRLVGVLNMNRLKVGRPFVRGDLDRASIIASQAMLALENSRLLRQMLATDRLATIGQMAASVAHEINNPVSFVLASHTFLKRRLEDLAELGRALEQGASGETLRGLWTDMGGANFHEDLVQVAADIEEGAARIRDIVFDLRGLARTEDVPVEVDFNDAVRSALRVAAAEIRGRARLNTCLGCDVRVIGISGRLSQILINLIANAAQAVSEKAAGLGEIRITTRREGQRVIAEIFNNGPPIPPAHLPRIFEPFFTTKSASVGTGLGLSVSRELVRRHKGEIVVDFSHEGGTQFTISIPAAPTR
jgi:signal transduction histidine kinase